MACIRPSRAAASAASAAWAVTALSAGCGGGERQDSDEPAGRFKVEVVRATFPRRQSVAQRSVMRVRVRNAGAGTLPDVALTVKTRSRHPGGGWSAFGQAQDDVRLADPDRPVWIVDSGPRGGDTAYASTWALGRLPPDRARTFAFRVTAVQPGRYVVAYEVSPGLSGRARAAVGSRASGAFRVRVTGRPADARVGADGEVVRRRR